MKELLLALLIFFSFKMSAQDYTPFPSNNSTWKESSQFIGKGFCAWSEEEFSLQGDTIVSDTTYSKLFVNFENQYLGGLREFEKQIFFRPSANLTNGTWPQIADFDVPDVEYLIYDFNDVQVGSILLGTNREVLNIDSIEIDAVFRTVYELQEDNSSYYQTSFVIEGIGSSLGLLGYRKNPGNTYKKSMLACFTSDLYQFPNPYHDEVIDCQVGTNIQELETQVDFSTYPNPTKDFITISSASRVENITVLNSLGKELKFLRGTDQNQILDISELNTGVYLVLVEFENGLIQSKRVIKN